MTTELLAPAAARAQVAQKLRRLARAQVRLERVQAELDEQLDAVRQRYDGRVASLQDRLSRMLADLEAHCRGEREAILPPGRKSLVTPSGEVGFRKGEPTVRLCEGLAEEEVCRLLRAAQLAELVRAKEAPDKPAVRKALRDGRVSREQLRRCGLELADGRDRFYCKVGHGGPNGLAGAGRNRG